MYGAYALHWLHVEFNSRDLISRRVYRRPMREPIAVYLDSPGLPTCRRVCWIWGHKWFLANSALPPFFPSSSFSVSLRLPIIFIHLAIINSKHFSILFFQSTLNFHHA